MGFVVLLTLTLLNGVASIAVAVRSKPAGRTELVVVTGILWNAMTTLPAFALGLANRLTPYSLGTTALCLAAIVLSVSFVGTATQTHARAIVAAGASVIGLARDAFRESWGERTLVFPGLIVVSSLIFYSAVVSYFAPSWGAWDALWYHEPITGFAIQNHGFKPIGGLDYGVQKVDGYPRICEMLQLWFVIFTDRRLIEIANSLISPLFLAAIALLVRRFGKDRISGVGFAVGVFLMPDVLDQLQTTYIDVHAATFLIAAAYFVTRAPLRLSDAALGAISLVLSVGSKHMALAAGGLLTLILLFRVCRVHFGSSPKRTVAVVAAASFFILGMCAAIYLRNLILFHNPFWPELNYDNSRLGIHWPGRFGIGAGEFGVGTERIHMQLPLREQLEDLFSLPYSWQRGHYAQVFGYGVGVAWLVIPLGILAAIVVQIEALRAAIAHFVRGRQRAIFDSDLVLLALLGVVLVACLWTSPALWGPRYNIVPVVLMVASMAWVAGRRGLSRPVIAASNIVIFGGLLMLAWSPRRLQLPTELLALASHPYPERELLASSDISKTLPIHRGSPILYDQGLARERELTAGTILVHGTSPTFTAVLWNNNFSNKVVRVEDGPNFVQRAEEAGATWIHAANASDTYSQVKASSRWQEVGPLYVERWGVAFRRAP